MGLSPEIVPSDMKQSIMEKLGLQPTKSTRSLKDTASGETGNKKERVEGKSKKVKKDNTAEKQDREEQARLAAIKESDLFLPGNSSDKLTLNDLFSAMNPDDA